MAETTRETPLAREQRLASKSMGRTGYAIPFHRLSAWDRWKKGRRIIPDYFRMIRSVWKSPWFTSEKSALKNFGSSTLKAGRLTAMLLGAIPASAAFLFQQTTKPFAWGGKKLFKTGGRLVKSKNPFKVLWGGEYYMV